MFKGTSKLVFLALALSWIPIACTANTDPEATTPVLQQLRITNNGDTDIVGLVVLFPGSAWDAEASRVEFGNIPAGKTTEYQNIPSGVYRYAAYEYILDGEKVSQFVIDWVGESPIEGEKFTYQIALDINEAIGNQIKLFDVLTDES